MGAARPSPSSASREACAEIMPVSLEDSFLALHLDLYGRFEIRCRSLLRGSCPHLNMCSLSTGTNCTGYAGTSVIRCAARRTSVFPWFGSNGVRVSLSATCSALTTMWRHIGGEKRRAMVVASACLQPAGACRPLEHKRICRRNSCVVRFLETLLIYSGKWQ